MSKLFPLADMKTPGLAYSMSQTIKYGEKSTFPQNENPINEASVQRRTAVREMYRMFTFEVKTSGQQAFFLKQLAHYQNEGIQLFDTGAYKLHVSLERTEANFERFIACMEKVMEQPRFETLEFKYKLVNLSDSAANTLRAGAELTVYVPANTTFTSSEAAVAKWSEFIEAVTAAATEADVKPHPEGITETDKAINGYFSYRIGNNGGNPELAKRVVLLDPAGRPMTRTTESGDTQWVKATYYDARFANTYNPLKLNDLFEGILNQKQLLCSQYGRTDASFESANTNPRQQRARTAGLDFR